ncbi:MAG: hypothetical protein QXT19_00340 [Candidatus Woesearchaeota archaeon]
MDDSRAPVFVKVEDYNAILELLNKVKERLKQARTLLAKVNELKQEEDRQIENWAKDIDDVEERLTSISQSFTEPQA